MSMPFRVLGRLHLLSATGAQHVHGHRSERAIRRHPLGRGPRWAAEGSGRAYQTAGP